MTLSTNPVGLRADNVTFGYRGRPVVSGLDLGVHPGEVLVVLGTSGCGKSTLLRSFAGLLAPMAGSVSADGVPILGPSADRALVFQDDALLPWRNVQRNVELPLAVRGITRQQRRNMAEEWLERVGLRDKRRSLPGELSGGMRQRVQLARVLAGGPGAVLMDEPFGALDAQSRTAMQRLLVDTLDSTRSTVVFVTHDVDEALVLGDRVVVLGREGIGAEYVIEEPRSGTSDSKVRESVLLALGSGETHQRMAVA